MSKHPDLAGAFAGREGKAQAPDVPERIKAHAHAPELRPEGSWRARADAVDQAVREAQEAAKAKNDWAKRIKTERGLSMGMAFRRGAKL